MNSLPKPHRFSRLRRLARPRAFFAISVAATSVSIFSLQSAHAQNNTPDNFTGAAGGATGAGTDLTNASFYSGGFVGTSSNDVLLQSTASALTANTSLTFGSLDVTNGSTYSIANAGTAADTLTLGSGLNEVGTSTADLIFLNNNSTLTLTGGTGTKALGVVLASNGNFDVTAGSTLTVSSIISGAFSLAATGGGNVTLSGANTFSNGFAVQNGTATGTVATAFGPATGTVTLGLASSANSATLVGGGSVTFANPIVLAASDTGALTIATTAAALTPIFSGGVTGTNSLRVNDAGTGNLTFSTAAVNNAGTVTNVGTGTGSVIISTGGVGTNVTGLTESSATSPLTVSGALTVNSGGNYADQLLHFYHRNHAAIHGFWRGDRYWQLGA